MKNIFDPNNIINRTKEIKNAIDQQMFNTDEYQETQINIRPSKNVSLGMFRPDPLIPGGHIAHPTTIRAMRKSLFMLGDNFIDLEKKYTCEKCKKTLDLQFWILCPYCETPFPKGSYPDS